MVSGAKGDPWEPSWEPTGAGIGRHQATSSDCQCRRSPHQAMPGDVGRRWGCALGAGGRGFESRHPDQKCSSEAPYKSARQLSRSFDRHLTVDLNICWRYWSAQTGSR
jgi:hypothetical protein